MAPNEIDAAHLAELRAGRLFVHAFMTSTTTRDPAYGRVVAWDDRQVVVDLLHREHGQPERAERRAVSHEEFFTRMLGAWHPGEEPPRLGPRIEGYRLPLPPRRSDRGQRW